MTRTRSHRPLRALLTVLLAAGAVAVPAGASHAAPASFHLSVSGNGHALGTADGSIDASGTTASYSVTICGQSTYPSSRITIKAGSATAYHSASSGSCQAFSGTLSSTSTIMSATVTLTGATFVGSTHKEYSRDTTVRFGASTPPPPAVLTTRSFDLTARGGYNSSEQLGNAVGSITATRGQKTASYTVQLCGQRTYPNASVTISAGTATVTHWVSYQDCQTFSGTLTSGLGISIARVNVTGGTFYPGNTYQTATRSTTLGF